MFDRFIGQDLFRGVDEGHINGRRLAAGRKPLLVEPISYTGAPDCGDWLFCGTFSAPKRAPPPTSGRHLRQKTGTGTDRQTPTPRKQKAAGLHPRCANVPLAERFVILSSLCFNAAGRHSGRISPGKRELSARYARRFRPTVPADRNRPVRNRIIWPKYDGSGSSWPICAAATG